MEKIETIVFDLGGVLIDWNPEYVFKTIFNKQEELEFFLTQVCNGEWNAQQDKGRPFEEAIKIKQDAFPEYRDIIPLYFERWHEMISGEIKETVDILEQLYHTKEYRLYALTNWSDETFPYAWEHFPFLRLFEGILVSGKEKLIKPDPAIYHLLFKRFDINPSSAIFIDDSEKNVTAANDVGMKAIHFKDGIILRKSLADLGIVL